MTSQAELNNDRDSRHKPTRLYKRPALRQKAAWLVVK